MNTNFLVIKETLPAVLPQVKAEHSNQIFISPKKGTLVSSASDSPPPVNTLRIHYCTPVKCGWGGG